MSWPTFLTPTAAWLFLLLIPLVLLYLMKLRRPPRELSSLVLWRQVLEDQRINSPFQKFKRNLLLLLQLIVLLLFVLAAMQPSYDAVAGDTNRVLVLLDRSASMAALDKPLGKTRLELGKERVAEMIEGLLPDQQLGLIAFAKSPRLIAPFTADKRVLRRALLGIEVHDQNDDLASALRMAGALATTTPIDRVDLISDGNLTRNEDVALPFAVDYKKLERGGTNLGITRLAARRDAAGQWAVFAGIECSATEHPPCRVKIKVGGELRHTEPVVARGGQVQRIVFPVPATDATSVELELEVDGFDSLAADNRGLLELVGQRPIRVLADAELESWRRALTALGSVELVADKPDLVVTKDEAKISADTPVALTVGLIPNGLDDVLSRKGGGSVVIDWERSDAALHHAELSEVVLLDRVAWQPGHAELDLEQRGFEVIVHGDHGPLWLRRGIPGHQLRYALLFDSARSTLPYRVSFPVICANLVTATMQAIGLHETPGLRAGVLPTVEAGTASSASLRLPDGSESTLTPATAGRFTGVSAPRCGWYELRAGTTTQRFGINLLERDESLLTSQSRLAFRDLMVAASDDEIETARPLWSTLLWLALPVLLYEWWLFRRKPRAKTRIGAGS